MSLFWEELFMKKNRIDFKEKRRYAIKKVSGKTASVFIGATIFGIILSSNLSIVNTKADTLSNTTATTISNDQTSETSNVVTLGNNQKAESSASNDATEEVQQSSASKNATANNSTEAATTSQSAPKTQGSADTDIKSLDIRSLTAISAAKLATMNLMQTNGINGTDTDGNATGTSGTDTGRTAAGTSGTVTGSDRSAAVTVNPDNINTQPAKENQKLANEHNLTSSDNYSSNIYKGTDGKYYKIVTIYGNDYVYRAADIQASGADLLGRPKQTYKDTKNNINISKEDLGNGKTRWTVVFFPNKGLQNYHSTLSGLSNAKFGIALTSDYQIVGNVDMDVISDPNQTFVAHTFKDNSNRATDITVQNPSPEVKFSFDPKTDVDPYTGLINSKTMPAYNNKYLQGPYYFTTATNPGAQNLWQTYFKDADERKNAYDGTTPYLGGNHDFHFNTFKIANETGVDGAKYGESIIYDKLGHDSFNGKLNSDGVFSSDNFNQAMEFKSQGYTGDSQSQFSSYVISFTTQHTDSHEVELTTGSGNQQFSGIAANIYSFQNAYYSMMSSLYGEQRALDPAGALVEAKKIIPHWGDVKPYMDKIKQDYLNNAQINVLRNKILNNITDTDAVNNIITEGNSLNDAMKKLGNSIGQYVDPKDDPKGFWAKHKEDTTKESDRYKYANPDKKAAYDNATEVTKALINKDTGTYADQATVETLTTDENNAWSALDGKKPTDTESYHVTAKDGVSVDKGEKVDPGSLVNVTDPAGKQVKLPAGSVDWKEGEKPDLSTYGDKTGKVEVTLPDGSKTEVPVHLHVNSDAESDQVTAKDGVSVDKGEKVDPGSLVNVTDPAGKQVELPAGSVDWKEGAKPDLSTSGDKTGKVEVTFPDGSKTEVPVHLHVNSDAESDKVTAKDGVSVDKGEKVDPGSLVNVTDPAGKQVKLPAGSVDWKEGEKPDLSTYGDKTGKVEVTLPDGSKTEVPVHLHVNSDAESDKVTAKDGVSVDKGEKVDPGSLVNVTDPAGKQVELPAGSVDWKEGAKPDLSTSGDKTGKVEVTFPDGSKTEVPVHLHVNSDAESDKVTAKDGVSVDKGEKVDPGSLVNVTDPAGKQVELPAGSVDWKEGAKPDLSTSGDKTGKVEVTFPDGSKTEVPVHLHVNSDAESDKVTAKDGVSVDKGEKVDPGSLVNVTDPAGKQVKLPAGSVDWKEGAKPDLSTYGDKTGKVEVTLPDGSKTEVPVHLHVNSDAERDHVTAKDGVSVDKGEKVDPGSLVNVTDPAGKQVKLPAGSVDWKEGAKPDLSTYGDKTGKVEVTLPDGSKTEVPVHLHVNSDAERDHVTAKDGVSVDKGEKVDPGSLVNVTDPAGKQVELPAGSVDWKEGAKPDLSTSGDKTGKVEVTFPDGSKTEVPVHLHVNSDAESDKVTAKDGVSVDKGEKVDPGSLVNVTDPAGKQVKLPAGSVDWKEGAKPDLSTYGDKTGKVEVTLPDGSKTEVPVHLHVNSDAERDHVTAKDGVSVDKGEKVDPGSLVNVTDPAGKQVKLPAGSVDWKEGAKPDLSTYGDKTGKVEVTLPDGSKKDTDVTIHVKTDAETYDPKAQPWTTTVGKTPKADEVISSTDKNGKKMPSDAKYTWKTEPNTSKTGEAFGEVKVTYSDGSHDDVPVTINVKDKDKLNDKEKYHIYGKDGLKVDNGKTLDPKDTIVVKDIDGNQTTLPEGSTVKWTKGKEPDFSQAGKDVTGEVTVTYPDHTQSDSVTVTVHVNGESDEYKVAPRDGVTVQRGGQVDPESTVVAQTPDGKPTSFPDGTKHEWITKPDTDSTGKRTGVVKTTFQDGSTTTTTVSVNVEPNQSDKITPNVPSTKEPVANTSSLTKDEKDKVKTNVTDANKDKFPAGTKVDVGDDGTATVTYPDGSKDTIPGDQLVQGQKGDTTDAGNITPTVPGDKVTVKDPSHLTDDEKNQVKNNVDNANKDKFPAGTDVTVGDDGTATVNYPDGSKDTIPGDQLVQGQKGDTTDAGNITPTVPGDKVTVKDPSHLTDDEKNQVKNNVDNANKDKFPAGTDVTVGDDGTTTVNYPDGSKDTIPGDQLVQGQKGDTTDAGKITPTVPGDKVTVKDPSHLTDDEKNQVKNNVDNANKDKFPGGTDVKVGDDGTTTVTYPDGSKDTIPGDQLVQGQKGDTTDAGNITPTVPGGKVTVKDPSHLTDDEKKQVKNNVDNANKDKFPAGTDVTVGDDGTATVTYPDGSKDTIPGDQLVQGQKGDTTDAGNITPTVPGDKVTVKDPSHLTDDEKKQVKNNVDNANKDKFPAGTDVTVGDDGTATVTYPDGSKDTIPGDQLVQGQKGDTTDAGNITPTVPGDKVTVKDPSHLTDDEKKQVKNNVDNANKDKFPAGTDVTVGDDGTATVTYPDGSKDTIPGDQLVQGQKGDTTDAGNITPTVPGDKVTVKDPSHLTDDEKKQVKNNVDNANKDKFPAGTDVTVGDDGTATVTYPDGSKDTIPGDQLVQGQKGDTTDAGNITPTVPGDKVTVKDPSHLTDDEKKQVKNNVDNANKDKFPAGTDVTVGDDGTATVNYPDGSKDTIPGDQLVQGQKGDTTDAGNITPTVPGDKVTVKDPSHLTDDEKKQVKNNVDNANKDKFPAGTDVTVGDDGTATVNYPDGSKDTIPGDQLVQGQKGDTTDAGNITPTVPGDKVTVKDPSHLTDDEKNQVKNNVDNANKDKFPAGTDVTVGDDGTTTVNYPDGSKDTIPGDQLVQGQKGDTTDAGNITPTVPGDKVTVKDPSHLTDDEKNQVKNNVDNANKDKFPGGTDVKVGDDGTTTVTYPDGSKDTIPGDQLVQGQKGDTTDADKITPTVPGDKVTVKDPSHLTDDEKNQVKNNVDNANKDKFPGGTDVKVGDDGTTTVTYPDGSKDTIPGSDLVRQSTDADKTTPSVPETKVPVADPSHLTDSEKDQVKTNVTDANKDNLPSGSQITVGNDGTTTVTYPDGSKDTIPGDKVLEGKSDVKSDADKNEPKEPGDKVKVDDPNKLTDSEKEELSNNLEKLNPGTVVTIADDGTATLTYPDGSTNTIPGSQLVTAKGNGNTTNSNVKVTPTNTNNKINKDNNSLGKNTANAKAGELPQTGENNDSQKLSVIGMALIGILGLFGLGKKRKKD